MTNNSLLTEPLMHFAEAVRVRMAAFAEGEPEDHLRTPFENFMASVGGTLGWDLVCKGDTPLPDRLGKPGFAVARSRRGKSRAGEPKDVTAGTEELL